MLFLCAGNSCRSQMAEGLLRHMAPQVFDVHSAGVETHGLNPNAVDVMAEIGIDISHHRSKCTEEYARQTFDCVVTVCDDSENNPCPVFLGQAGKRLHVPVTDPAAATGSEEEILGVFRQVRDQIKAELESFASEASEVGS